MINIVTAFQVVLLILMVIMVIGVIAEDSDRNLRASMAGMFFASLGAFIVSQMWF